MFVIAAATVMAFAGCKSTPSAAKVEGLSYAAGAGVAYACELTKMDSETKIVMTNVMTIVSTVVPETNSTCVATWTPVVSGIVDKYVAEGTINAGQAKLITTTSYLAAQGVDYLFARHSDWKEYSDLVSVSVKAFSDGFIAVFVKYNVCGGVATVKVEYDPEAYEFAAANFCALKAMK